MKTTTDAVDIPTQIEKRRTALSVAELATLLGLSAKTIYDLVSRGHIPYYRIAGSIRFDPALTAAWLRSQAAV
jgi:excisionase family DNA binding protein